MKRKNLFSIALAALFFSPSVVFAQFCGGVEGRFETAIGCIDVRSPQAFSSFFLRWGIGAGAGVGFLLSLYAGFMIMTSQGDPKKLGTGQQLLTASLGGLLFLVFSAFILQLIGVSILNIPGF